MSRFVSLISDVLAYALVVLFFALISRATLGMFEKMRVGKKIIYAKIEAKIMNKEGFAQFVRKRKTRSAIGLTIFILLCVLSVGTLLMLSEGRGRLSASAWALGVCIGQWTCSTVKSRDKYSREIISELEASGVISK